MRPTTANQIRTCVLNSLMTSDRPLTHLKHLHEVKGRNRRIANLQSSHQNPMMCGFSVLTFRLTIWLPDWRNKRLTPVNSPSHQSKSYQNPSGAPSVRTSYAFSCLGIFWSKTVAFMSALFRTYSTVPASRKPDSPASASASLIPFTSILGAFSGVTYPASVDRLSALLIPMSTSFLYEGKSKAMSSGRRMVPLSNATAKVSPASIGFSPSFERTEAILALIGSPFRATTESCATHMLPPSIFVLTLISPNSLMTGPGGSPVLPAGIMISPVAMSPALAGALTFLFSSRMISEYGLSSEKRRKFDPVRALTNSPSFSSLWSDSSTDLRRRLFLATIIVTRSRDRFRNS